VLRVQRPQIGVRRRRRRDLGHDDPRILEVRLQVEQRAELCRIGASAAGKARIFENGEVELDLGDSLCLERRRQAPRGRQLERRGGQAPIIGFANLVDGGLRLGREPHGGHP
jgi:hypothetical protein